uniref:ATP-grasp fold amidoligase family protein n=1 Tax=Shewanella baltica TaxID=62322 RepID=UPI00404879C0
MIENTKKILRKNFPKLVSHWLFFKCHKYWPNIRTPKTFSEKILARKFSPIKGSTEKSDKYLVRKYVSDKIGENYLIPLHRVTKSLQLTDLDGLPKSYVIKSNHASGSDHLEIVYDADSIDKSAVIDKFSRAMKVNYGIETGESQYLDIESLVLIEDLIGDQKMAPEDFKFHIFNNQGNIKWFLQVDIGRFSNHRRNIYNDNFELCDFKIKHGPCVYKLPSRERLLEMSELAIKLAGGVEYVRVDFYLVNEKIYFGEMTYTHGGGYERFYPKNMDEKFGSYWN